MKNPTQEGLNEAFNEFKMEWDNAVIDSGVSQSVFIATDRTGFVASAMTEYEQSRIMAEELGLVMPVFIEGLKVTVTVEE